MTPTKDSGIQFQQVFNFRDIGGHATESSRHVRRNVLFRSAALTDATQGDVELLAKRLHVQTLLDLRNSTELDQFPMRPNWPCRIANLVLCDESDDLTPFSTLGDGYVDWLRRPHIGKRLVEALSLLTQEGTLPAVIFCGAGKDRTGLVTAAILGTLNVGDETIIADYAKSAEALEALYSFWAKNPASTIEKARHTTPHVMGAPREAMAAMLTAIRRDYGSMRGYLKASGADAGLFQSLEETLLA
jgi:protein tyrosine/serine phosphatase